MSRFELIKDYTKFIKKYNVRGRTIEFKIHPVPADNEPLSWVKGAIEEIVRRGISDVDPTDKVGVSFWSLTSQDREPGWLSFRNADQLKTEILWETIARIHQSNSSFLNTDTFRLGITIVHLPRGTGNNRIAKYNTFDEECIRRRGIVTINNKDHLCLPRALVVCIAHVDKDPAYEKVKRDVGKQQLQRANRLCIETCVEIPKEGAGIPELRKFQDYLKYYKITVYQYGNKGRDVIFEGANEGKRLNLLYFQGHYNVITSLTAAFCCSYYCQECHVPYNSKKDHRCGGTCVCCRHAPACEKTKTEILCQKCNRSFRGKSCFGNHQASGHEGKSICEVIRRCSECLKTYTADREHTCGEIFCKVCDKHVAQDHQCYIQPDRRQPITKGVLFVFYDLETMQEKTIGFKTFNGEMVKEEDEVKLHEPNLCVYAQRCETCLDVSSSELSICQKCGLRQNIIKREDSVKLFVQYVLAQRKIFKKVIVIAHNGQAFDHQFVLNNLLNETDIEPKLIMRGTKIILMQIDNIKFIDSINYFPMALSKLPKAFDLPQIFKKGYFPHLFNTRENENYVGPLPPMYYYSPDSMKVEEREVFLEWYDQHRDDQFIMHRDLVDYCISDVQILTEACVKFHNMMMNECKVSPFVEAVTIASACNLVFRRNFLKANTIGIIPKNGYRHGEKQSKEALQWLIKEERERGINIQYVGKGKEIVVCGMKVDGFCSDTKQVFEYHGCYFHGHPTCLLHGREDALQDDPEDTLSRRYEATVAKTERLRKSGYEVIEMWSCEFEAWKKEYKRESEFLENHPLLSTLPLNPRDAFYGGRTGNVYTYYECKEGEKIKYIDVCSLYPWVCKNGKFPVGHPEVIVGNDACSKVDLNTTDGLIKCKILAPEGLLHPVLPVKQDSKLMFPLCRSCSEEKSKSDACPHTDEERSITGTWVIDEVMLATEKGYQILEIFEIWRYNVVQYNKSSQSGGLFSEMMNKFLKMKQQASGWPSKCNTSEAKNDYIKEFSANEGIKLEFDEINNNPGLRSLAKLILNSFWGKFGQRENQSKTSIIRNPAEFFGLFVNPAIEVNHVLPINEDVVVVGWEYKEEAADSLPIVNVAIAAYTTTQARIKLYGYLDQLGDKVLYYDTDSVIYVSDGTNDPPTGECVGDMTDELEGYGVASYIQTFVSGGPKHYAYRVYSTTEKAFKTVCKVKGISLNYNTSQIVNFESIKEAVLREGEDGESQEIILKSRNIRRTREFDVVTTPEIKQYRVTSEKRRFLEDYSSRPYGYKRSREET